MIKKNVRYVSLRVVSTIQVEEEFVDDLDGLAGEINGQYIKIKSGAYENIACGSVDSVEVLGTEIVSVEVFGDEDEDEDGDDFEVPDNSLVM